MVRANNVAFEFTIIDFLLMNLNDLIIVSKILCEVDSSQVARNIRMLLSLVMITSRPSLIASMIIWLSHILN